MKLNYLISGIIRNSNELQALYTGYYLFNYSKLNKPSLVRKNCPSKEQIEPPSKRRKLNNSFDDNTIQEVLLYDHFF